MSGCRLSPTKAVPVWGRAAANVLGYTGAGWIDGCTGRYQRCGNYCIIRIPYNGFQWERNGRDWTCARHWSQHAADHANTIQVMLYVHYRKNLVSSSIWRHYGLNEIILGNASLIRVDEMLASLVCDYLYLQKTTYIITVSAVLFNILTRYFLESYNNNNNKKKITTIKIIK